MPAMPLIRVLLPAPLSPTRAVTSPARASKSTPCRTWTAPKLLLIPRRASNGVPCCAGGLVVVALGVVMLDLVGVCGWGRPGPEPGVRPSWAGPRAVGQEMPAAVQAAAAAPV